MSISILNRGGISGGLKPELTVTAPSGSTIDLMQNGIIVATYTLGASETEHTFMVKVGTYTVRGTLETQMKSVEVVIDAVGQYAVKIQYNLVIYDNGAFVTPSTYFATGGTSNLSITMESDHLLFRANGGADKVVVGYRTTEKVDVTDLAKMKVTFNFVSSTNNNFSHIFCGLSNLASPTYNDTKFVTSMLGGSQPSSFFNKEQTLELDVSEFDGEYYVTTCYICWSDREVETFKMYKLWLE